MSLVVGWSALDRSEWGCGEQQLLSMLEIFSDSRSESESDEGSYGRDDVLMAQRREPLRKHTASQRAQRPQNMTVVSMRSSRADFRHRERASVAREAMSEDRYSNGTVHRCGSYWL